MHNRPDYAKNTDAGQMDEGEEARCELVKAHGNTAELLKIEEEGFHKLAFLVQPPIHVPGVGIIRCRQDTEIRVMVGDELAKFPLAIGSVGEDGRSSEINLADQFFGNGDVSGITGGQQNRDGIAQSVYSSVNLGGSAATAHSNALIGLRLVLTNSRLLGRGILTAYGF